MEKFERSSGVLLPLFSLPNDYGIGTFGKESYDFIDFLERSGFKIWQMLPLNLTSFGDSPYQSPSNYGLSYYYISYEILIKKKLLKYSDIKNYKNKSSRVDYSFLFNTKVKILKKAFLNFNKDNLDFKTFLKDQNYRDFAFYMVLKELNSYKSWKDFDKKYINYSPELEKEVIKKNKELFLFYMWTQYEFLDEFNALKEYAHKKNILILGDMPFYVSYDSIECYKYSYLFDFNDKKEPKTVSGHPPDGFSKTGQLWGNPCYNFKAQKEDNYKWYSERIKNGLTLFDILRIDHFRGFSAYYSIPFKDKTAENGKWVKGPGFNLFKDKLDYKILAEDLGYLDKDFYSFFKKCGYPGMKIVHQCFLNWNYINEWRPSIYEENYFAYTSTHDSETLVQFLSNKDKKDKKIILKVLNEELSFFKIKKQKRYDIDQIVSKIIELTFANKAVVSIIPIWDILKLGEEARINLPSTLSTKNWSYKINSKDLKKLYKKTYIELKNFNELYDR